jgi:hypothetical protein
MTERLEESAPETPETQAPPVPEKPADSGDERTSAGREADVAQLVQQLVPGVRDALIHDEEFIRQNQTIKDRRLKLLDEDNPALVERVVAYLKKYDGDQAEVQRQLQIDALISGKTSGQASEDRGGSSGERPASEGPDLATWATSTLFKAGIPFSDPEYSELVRIHNEDKTTTAADFKGDVRLMIARRRASGALSPAAIAGEGSGAAASNASIETLAADYKKEMTAARGQGMEVGREIQAKYIKKGLDVYQIPVV